MGKKLLFALLSIALVFAAASPLADHADAKPRYRSPSRSYNPDAPKQTAPARNADRTDDGATANRPGAATPGAGRTGFGGGGLMRGLMLGGLAGLLFGGLLSGLGGFGALLGLAVNVLGIVVLFLIARKLYRMFVNRPKGGTR